MLKSFECAMKKIIPFLSNLIATFCYLGYVPIAPGTAGAFGGVILYLLLWSIGTGITAYSLVIVILFLIGLIVASYEEKRLKKKDASQIVIDEAVSILVTMYLIPFSWAVLAIGFVLNRVLDIVKPFPANKCEKMSGGFGVMTDDLVSAIYSNILLKIIILLTGWGG